MERYRSAADDFIAPYIKQSSFNERPIQLLDVGAGDGYLQFFLKGQPIDWHGIDCDEKRVKICEKLGYKMSVLDIEQDELPYRKEQFDVIVASHVLEHLYHPDVALEKIYRVLKPNGILIIGVPMHPGFVAKILLLKEKLFPSNPWSHHQFYSMRTLKEFLADYQVEDIRGFRMLSARKRLSWEDHHGFYRFNTWFGKNYPALSPEVNAVIRKPA